ncbi:MAG: FeoB-associated Cys-rich membrane protein [Clostridiales bacterium]|nr:FeoB-associated Cys-rich membrane protein [Clostridiales bacterium]
MTALEIVLIILIILFVGGIVGWKVFKAVRNKKAAKTGGSTSSCGCGCAGCAASGSCPSASAAKDKYYGDDPDDAMPEINVQSEVTCDFTDLL